MTSPKEILDWFEPDYIKKFEAGQKEHGGNLTDMGLKQAFVNFKQEQQDSVSYSYVIEKCIDAIEFLVNELVEREYNEDDADLYFTQLRNIKHILDRIKND